jgi:hypothetical protein
MKQSMHVWQSFHSSIKARLSLASDWSQSSHAFVTNVESPYYLHILLECPHYVAKHVTIHLHGKLWHIEGDDHHNLSHVVAFPYGTEETVYLADYILVFCYSHFTHIIILNTSTTCFLFSLPYFNSKISLF